MLCDLGQATHLLRVSMSSFVKEEGQYPLPDGSHRNKWDYAPERASTISRCCVSVINDFHFSGLLYGKSKIFSHC